MSIQAKHAYRFGFLKSEKWRNLRLERLVEDDGECTICGVESFSNDIHHVSYPKDWRGTSVDQLRTLCRNCHEVVHFIMDYYPDWEPRRVHRFARRIVVKLHLTATLAWVMHFHGHGTGNVSGVELLKNSSSRQLQEP